MILEGSSWHAYQVRDRIFCGGTDVLSAADPIDQKFGIHFLFGCQTSATGLFVTQLADGIMVSNLIPKISNDMNIF